MLPFKLIYHPGYDLHLGAHVFPSQKFRLIHDRLLEAGIATPEDFLAPEPASDEDVLRVHSHDYVYKLKHGSLSHEEILRLEVPYSKELIDACWLAAGGSILAGRRALADGWAANIGGGFHHACPDHGEGFCVIHDVAIAIRRLQFDGAIEQAMVVDTDVHHGNGTAAIFGGDRNRCFYASRSIRKIIIRFSSRPRTSTSTCRMAWGTMTTSRFSKSICNGPSRIFRCSSCSMWPAPIPYREDQLGGLALTMEGLARRDALVYDYASRNGVPVASALAGGLRANALRILLNIHVGTILAARDAAQRGTAGMKSQR